MADGTTYQIDIPVDASQVGAAGTAVERLEAQLKAAGAASAAAGEAVKAGAIAYNQAESAANKAAAAAEKIGMAAEAQRGKLAEAMEVGDMAGIASAEAALESLGEKEMAAAEKAAAARDVLQQKATALDALKDAAKAAGAAEDKLAGDLDKMKKAGTGGNIKLNEMAESLGKLGGPAGMAGQKIAGIGNALQKMAAMGPAAVFIAIGVAAVAVVAGIAAATVALLKFGLANADAARTSALLSQGIAGSVDGGKALDKTIASLGTKVPMTAAELQTMAGQLAKTGLKGDALSVALEDAAVKASRLKFGPDFAKAMLSADFQSKKLKADVGKIFGGLKIEGLLTNLAKLGALFDEDSSSAKAIKVVFESFFQPLVDGMEGMIPKVIAGFIQVEIWAMKGLIGIQRYQPVIDAVGAAMLFFGKTALVALGIVGGIIAVVAAQTVGFMVAIKATWDAMTGLSAGAIQLGVALIGGVQVGVASLIGKFTEMKSWLAGLNLSDIGTQMINGLVNGLLAAGPQVLAAITGVANGAITAAKKALGIASPSKVFAEIGGHTAAGMEQGVDDGASGVQASMTDMATPQFGGLSGGAAGGGATASASSGGNTFILNFGSLTGDAADIAAQVAAEVQRLLDGDVSQLGGSTVTA